MTAGRGAASLAGGRPGVRHRVILLATTLAVITYVDRVCISQAAGDIQRDLALTDEQLGLVFAAFTLAYGLFEVPFGWLGDAFGPRRMLLRVVLMWSAFTAATGAAWNFASLVACRFLFGAGEAGCFPNVAKMFTVWLPAPERVRAQGIMWLSARWGGALTPLLVLWVMRTVGGWRWTFAVFGVLGIAWALWFGRWFRDNPRDHPDMTADELALLAGAERNATGHGDVPWRRWLTNRNVWLLWLPFFCMNYAWYFYITWLPKYLREARGVTFTQGAVLAGLPLLIGGLGSLVSGLMAGPAARWLGGVARARRMLAGGGLAAAAVLVLVSTQISSPTLAMVALGLASFANDLAMPVAWGTCMDIGGSHAGALSGSMNMMGQAGGTLCPLAVAWLLAHSGHDWSLTFWAAAAAYAVGAACWVFIDPVTPLDPTPGSASDARGAG